MSIEAKKRSEINLIKEQLNKLEGKSKLDFIDEKKVQIAKDDYTFRSLDLMVFLNTKQIQTENFGINSHAAYLKAHIQEATRLKTKLKQLQPKGVILNDRAFKKIDNLRAAKKHLGKEIGNQLWKASQKSSPAIRK